MKFNKNKAIAALSIALLLSTQTKPMGADFGIDAEEINQSVTLSQQAQQAFSTGVKSTVNALGIATNASVEAGKSAYNAYMTNPGLYTGIGAGVAGAGLFAYKKPQVAGKIATVAIPATMAGFIAKDNPEIVQAGKNAAINAGKAVYNYAAQNAPMVYNALTNNAVTDYIKENPEYVIPAAIAGAFGTYYAYAPVKRGAKAVGKKVAQAAKVVAPYAAKTALVAAPVAAVAAVAKYSPETLVAAKDAAINAGNSVLDAGKVAANVVSENTPDFVKNQPVLTVIGTGAAVVTANKLAAPVKRGVTKAAQAVAPHTGKIVTAGMIAGAAGLIAYDNQETIAAMAKDAVAAVVNADYATYGQKALDATVRPAGRFMAKQASNGANLVRSAYKLDYKKMAQNAGKYLADKKQVATALLSEVNMPSVNVNSKAVIGTAAVVGVASTGYALNETVKALNYVSEIERLPVADNVMDINEVTVPVVEQVMKSEEPIVVESYAPMQVEQPKVEAKKKVTFAPVSKPAPARPKAELPVTVIPNELNPAITLLPGEDKAPELAVYASKATRPAPLTEADKAELNKMMQGIEQRPVAQNVEAIATMVEELNKPKTEYAQAITLANEVSKFALTGVQKVEIKNYIEQLSKGQGNVIAITTRLNSIRRIAGLKAAAIANKSQVSK